MTVESSWADARSESWRKRVLNTCTTEAEDAYTGADEWQEH